MRAALQISQSGQTCALLSKVFPTRSHTVSAQGGILPLRWVIPMKITGNGICTTTVKGRTISVTRRD
ncbi:hypothetical protein DMI62_19660 [Escherichia coli]|nr:hypothetical protein [Escherichia coli]